MSFPCCMLTEPKSMRDELEQESDLRALRPRAPASASFLRRLYSARCYLFALAVAAVLAVTLVQYRYEAAGFLGVDLVYNGPSAGVYGTCNAQPSTTYHPLRWEADGAIADTICCHNHRGAEFSGSWGGAAFPHMLPAGAEQITFYDSASGMPLFVSPVGRSYQDFVHESVAHGWPSFRDTEVIWSNVVVLPGGETVSKNGTHLGHNLPDSHGNRYCINLACIAGVPRASSRL